jgi:ADP-heptose:LPS heptosyltransferase
MKRKIGLVLFILWTKLKQFFSFKRKSDRILIIKIEAIGDYLLFRNFIEELKASPKFKNSKITLIGNFLWGDLANKFDSGLFDEIYLVNRNTLTNDWFDIFKYIQKYRYNTVISYSYSRNPITDIFAFVASAKHKIAINGDLNSISRNLKFLYDLVGYNRLVDIPAGIKTEFGYNKFFTETLLGTSIETPAPVLPPVADSTDPRFSAELNYVVLSPGAGVFNRQPSIAFLTQLIEFITQRYPVYFVGSAKDTAMVEQVRHGLSLINNAKVADLTGKTSLAELPGILKNARLVVSNDSGLFHMAIAMNKPVLCIAGGGHFERFVDYVHRPNIKISYHPMACFNCDWKCIYKFAISEPYPCISNISAERAIADFISLENYVNG